MKLKKVKSKGGNSETIKEERKYSSLKEIMDYERDFEMFFSGVENDTYFNGCYEMGIRDFLMSYHYLQKSKVPMDKKYGGLGIKFFIDSGAHTYQNDPKYIEFDIEYWEKHIQKYLKWVERNKEYIFAIANCDFENLVGGDTVLEWNEKYFEPFMLRTGIPVCFVWHQNSFKSWEYYCQRYPYVGFSSVNTEGESIDMQGYKEHLKIAEKHNALVHGFGMTRTSMLPQLPFYTVDSTSWKAGFMYGQLAYWNGKKVSMVRKEGFEKAFQFIRTYELSPSIDEQLIKDYYEPEVLRANVFAYQKAVEFIQNALKSITYWKRPGVKKRSEKELDKIKFPSQDWLYTKNPQGWENYANTLNITTEDNIIAINCIADMTIFLNWDNEEYKDFKEEVYTEDLITQLHNDYINRIVGSLEEKIEDLQKFYKDCLMGENDKLLLLGTNFDRVVKERDEYLTDEEYVIEDISPMEVNNTLSKFLPLKEDGSAPEIDELDDEIFSEHDIIPVRDAKGHFLKGQRQVLRPKKLYSKRFPKLACDTCYNAQKCPEYKAGYVCAYNEMFNRYDTRDMVDIIQAIQGIVDFSLGRLQRGMLTEMLNGGMPDPNVTGMMNQTMGYLNQLKQMYEFGNSEVLRQTKILNSDGSQEITTQVTNPQQGGILEKIFGDLGEDSKDSTENDDIIDEVKD